MSSSATPQPPQQGHHPTTSTEYRIPSPPQHPISSIVFHPQPTSSEAGRRLLVSSWDSTVRLYQLPDASTDDGNVKAAGVRELHSFKHEAPVLDVCWISDELAASGGIDRRLRLLNLVTGESTILGKHASAISRVRYEPTTKMLLSSSWDKTLILWDPFSSKRLKTLQQPDKVLAMDITPPQTRGKETKRRAVLAMTGRQVRIYDLEELRNKVDSAANAEGEQSSDTNDDGEQWEAEQNRESSLKYMIRDVRCNPDGIGYATSSIEGRISVEFFDPSPESQARKYAFKCHRLPVDGIDVVYPVNNMGFHPVHGTFFSLGGDAFLSYWDPFSKKRIRQLPQFPTPLSCASFSADGNVIVIASGAENIEEKPSIPNAQGGLDANGEVGGIGKGGPGNIALWVRENASAESKPKTKPAA